MKKEGCDARCVCVMGVGECDEAYLCRDARESIISVVFPWIWPASPRYERGGQDRE